MPRACACERLFRRLEEDVRLRCLPLAAQALWLKLARLALAAPEAGVLRVGTEFGFLAAVSLAVSATETETGTHLETLRRRGLVEADEAEGILRVPDIEAQAARSNAARINGLRGGRPRKGETREQAAARRQGHMLLPLPKPKETEPESSRAASLESCSEKSVEAAREETDWVALGTELAALAGLDPARGGYSLQVVRGWLAMGATAPLLREVVARVAARAPQPIRSLAYFTQAVREALEAEAPPAPPPSGPSYGELLLEWHLAGGEGPPPENPYTRRSAA